MGLCDPALFAAPPPPAAADPALADSGLAAYAAYLRSERLRQREVCVCACARRVRACV